MRLISLELDNFRQHRSTAIEFLPGVTGIIGKNGCGKTTLLEAIAWALYGAPAVRGTNDTIRCRSAEGNATAEVRLKFDLGPHTYVVTRRLETSKSTANLTIDGLPARTGFKEVTEAVAKLLGMDYHAFFTSFFTGQKELEFMRGMDGRLRAAAISRMLGYERLVRARDRANQDRLGLAREIETLERGLGDPEEIKRRKAEKSEAVASAESEVKSAEARAASTKKDVDRLKPRRDLSEQKAKRHSELTRRVELDRAEEKRAAARVAEMKSQLEELAAKAKELESIAPQLEEYKKAGEEYKKLSELQKHETRRMDVQGRLTAVSEVVKSLESRAQELAPTPEEFTQADKTLAEIEKQFAEVERNIEKERDSFQTAKRRTEVELEHGSAQRSEIVEKRRAIELAGKDGKCPTCERPLVEELPKVLAGFDDQIAKLDALAEKLRRQLEGCAAEPESLTAQIALRQVLDRSRGEKRSERDVASVRSSELANCRKELESKQVEIGRLKSELEQIPSGFDQERYTQLRETGDRLRPFRDRSIQLNTELARRPEIETELNREQDSLTRARGEIATSEEALKQLSFSQDEHEKLVAEHEQAVGANNAANIEAERAKGDLRAAKAALAAAENDEKSFKSKEAELRDKRVARVELQTLAEAFDNLRTELNNRAAPELAAAASELLTDLTDGRYSALEVDDGYEATIRDDGELKPIISGGEEDIVNLALRLAVSTMIADRAGQDLSLLILDEVFGSLDDIRRENVVNLLQALKNRFEQIIIITHIESVHDAVDNCIWVDYDEASKTSSVRSDLVGLEIPGVEH